MAWLPQKAYDDKRKELELLTPEAADNLTWAEACARFVLPDTTMMSAWAALRSKREPEGKTPYETVKELWRIP